MPHWSVMSFTVIFSKGFTDNRFSNTLMITSFVNAAVLPLLLCPKCEPELLLYVRAAGYGNRQIWDFCHIGNAKHPPDGGCCCRIGVTHPPIGGTLSIFNADWCIHQTAVYLTGYFSSLSDRPYNQ